VKNIPNFNIQIYNKDISKEYMNSISKETIVAWDIETSGLDWKKDHIGICQLYTNHKPVAIVKIKKDAIPLNLCNLLTNQKIQKVFHHAIFDLRFMCYQWKIISKNISCTKIASKILEPNNDKHTLKSLLKKYLNVNIDKEERTSNWLRDNLSKTQVIYAANDTRYLLSLLDILIVKLDSKKLLKLTKKCFRHIPTRVQLDISGYDDIFTY